ncbi:hypothetical protein AB0B94_31035 [Micromonospora sp. NPDC048986]|uniref:hypothetical protein n=1 Tax=Micromonospora sp. NPDC048986 TaxID=3155644 RepID=UPI0033F1DB02
MKTAVAAFEPPRKPTLDFVPVPLTDPTVDKLTGLLETGTTTQVRTYWGYGISTEQVGELRDLFIPEGWAA